MINKVKITNLADAESYSFNKNKTEYDVWISVVGDEDRKQISRMRKNFKEKNVKFFHQFFADWSDEDGISWEHLKKRFTIFTCDFFKTIQKILVVFRISIISFFFQIWSFLCNIQIR